MFIENYLGKWKPTFYNIKSKNLMLVMFCLVKAKDRLVYGTEAWTLANFAVVRTISSHSGAPGVSKLGLFDPIRFVQFWGFCSFQFLIVLIYRAISKNISESTCGKSIYKKPHNFWILENRNMRGRPDSK